MEYETKNLEEASKKEKCSTIFVSTLFVNPLVANWRFSQLGVSNLVDQLEDGELACTMEFYYWSQCEQLVQLVNLEIRSNCMHGVQKKTAAFQGAGI